MTWAVYRNLGANGAWASGANQFAAPVGYKIVRLPSGPQGVAAGQDIGWGPLTGGFSSAETLNTPPLAHAATFSKIYAHTDSGTSGTRTLTINRKVASTVVQSTTFSLAPGVHDAVFTIAGAGLTGAVGDIFTLVFPVSVDASFLDLCVTLGSMP